MIFYGCWVVFYACWVVFKVVCGILRLLVVI